MVSSKINNLTESDLTFLERLIGAEFAKQSEYDKTFARKNGYASNKDSKTLLRLLNAVRSQKQLTNMPKW